MGLIGQCGRTIQSLTFPLTATGLSTIACIPRIADWGGLMIGVPIIEPNTPPLEMVKVPPSMSSIASSFVRAWEETKPGQQNLVHSTIVKWYAELSQMDTYFVQYFICAIHWKNLHPVNNAKGSLGFIFPIQTTLRFSREFAFWLFIRCARICTWIARHSKETVYWGFIT